MWVLFLIIWITVPFCCIIQYRILIRILPDIVIDELLKIRPQVKLQTWLWYVLECLHHSLSILYQYVVPIYDNLFLFFLLWLLYYNLRHFDSFFLFGFLFSGFPFLFLIIALSLRQNIVVGIHLRAIKLLSGIGVLTHWKYLLQMQFIPSIRNCWPVYQLSIFDSCRFTRLRGLVTFLGLIARLDFWLLTQLLKF